MRVAILFFCCALGFGQDTSSAPGTKPQNPAISSNQKSQSDYGLGMGTRGRQLGALDILSDTQDVDFGPYLQGFLKTVRGNWYHLIPESVEHKNGKLAIELAIARDGKIADMRLVATSGDVALDRPAWASITASNPFPSLPSEFKGQFLALRMRFFYNPIKSDLEGPFKPFIPELVEAAPTDETAPPPPAPLLSSTSMPSKSGVVVSISSPGDSKTAAGEARIMTPTVTGTEKQAVKWSISGQGCSNSSSCGVMVGNLYLAPKVPPIPNEVSLTAISEADPTAKTTVIVHIQESASKVVSKP